MNNIAKKFEFEGRSLTVTSTDGQVWFKMKEVCDWLEIINSRDAKSRLDKDEYKIIKRSDPIFAKFLTVGSTDGQNGGAQSFTIINESGFYTLVMSSRSAAIKGTAQNKFRKWVTSEVLPAIRQTGSYHQAQTIIDPVTGTSREVTEYEIPATRREVKEIVVSVLNAEVPEVMLKLIKHFKLESKIRQTIAEETADKISEVSSQTAKRFRIMRKKIKDTMTSTDIEIDRLERKVDKQGVTITNFNEQMEKTNRVNRMMLKKITSLETELEAIKSSQQTFKEVVTQRLNIHKRRLDGFKSKMEQTVDSFNLAIKQHFRRKRPNS